MVISKLGKLSGCVGGGLAYLFFSYKNRAKDVRLLKIAIDEGPQKPKGNLYFIHGWPDHGQLWRPLIDRLKLNYRCVAVDLPGCGTDSDSPSNWGRSHPELAQMINHTAREVFKGEPIQLVGHDWGAIISNLAMEKDPDLYTNYIGFDLPAFTKAAPLQYSALTLAGIIAYQMINIILFLMWNIPLLSYVSDWLTTMWLKIFLGNRWRRGEEYVVFPSGKLHYFYLHSWLHLESISNNKIPNNRTLFFISKDKIFEDKNYKSELESRTDGSAYIHSKHSGHWIMLDEPEFVMKKMEEFLEKYA